MIGKWHLGSDPTGFDRWTVLPGHGRYIDPVFLTPEGPVTRAGHVTAVTTDLAIEFLQTRPADKPFFLMYHHKAPRGPWEPDKKNRVRFAGKKIPEPPTLWDDYATRTDALRLGRQSVFRDMRRALLKLEPPADLPASERAAWLAASPTEATVEIDGRPQTLTGRALDAWKYQRYMQDYLACVQGVDDEVGRFVAWLDAHGLRENTVVIYTSDQGFFLGDHGLYDKRLMYEHALTMPFLCRWPGVARAGAVESAITTNCDFAPTFLDIAGLPIPADMQGRSLAPLLRGERPSDWRTAMYYRYYDDPGNHNTRAHFGLRTETHKLIHFWKQDEWECYDLTRDPDELRNIHGDPAQQTLVATLKAQLQRLKREMKDDDQFAHEQPKTTVEVRAGGRGKKG